MSRTRVIPVVAAALAGLMVPVAAQSPDRFAIDPAATAISIHVGRAGLFAFAGHEHDIVAPVRQGTVTVNRADVSRSSLSVEFDAGALVVTGRGEPPEDAAEVQRVMLSDRVLDVQRYPTITFRSRAIALVRRTADEMTLRVTGDLTLHGVTRALSFPVDVRLTADGLRADGRATVRQTAFGIRPVTAGGGTVRVKDEVAIVFSVAARRP